MHYYIKKYERSQLNPAPLLLEKVVLGKKFQINKKGRISKRDRPWN